MLGLVVGVVRLALRARPRRQSVAIRDFPPRKHLEIARGEPFTVAIEDRRGRDVYFDIPPLTVDDSTRLAQFQATVRSQIAGLKARIENEPEVLPVLAATRALFYRSFYSWLIDKAAAGVKWWRRRSFRRDARSYFEANEGRGHFIFDQLLKANAEVDSFFFEVPQVNGREVQPPNRDGWRSIGCGDNRERGQDLLSTPILKIYDMIVSTLERDCVERMNRKRREAEELE